MAGGGRDGRAFATHASQPRCARAAFTLIELVIALAIIGSVLVGLAGAFFASAKAVTSAQRSSRATVFLQTVLENLAAQPYDELTAFDGDRVYDAAAAAGSNWAVDLTVFTAAVDLQQVEAVLTDLQTNRVLTRVTTLRCRR